MDWRPEMTPLGEQAAANPAQNGITGIDHPVIAVRDMEVARQTFMRLGFTVPPRGSHVEWGTGNWCIMFPEDYLELRGIIDTDRPLQGLDSFIDNRGEGLMGVAFGTRNAKQARSLLLGSGVGVRKFTSLTRNFEHPGGWTQPQFDLCFPVEADVTGLMHVVLCEHKTPELLRPAEILCHENTTVAVMDMTGAVDDLDAVEECQKRLLGDLAVVRFEDAIRLTILGGQLIRLLRTDRFVKDYGTAAPEILPPRPYLGAITLRVTDLARTGAALEDRTVEFTWPSPGRRLRVPASQACGTVLDFVGS